MDTVTIIRCLHIIEDLNLKGKEIVKDLEISAIEAIYNGLGPDRFPEWLRIIITDVNNLLQPAAVIHDVRFDIGGTKEDFHAANREFYDNCLTIITAAYPWYDPRRYKWEFRAWRYYKYCEDFGWSGFHKSDPSDQSDPSDKSDQSERSGKN